MNKVYHINVVGVINGTRTAIQYQENVICEQQSDALNKYKDAMTIWSSTVKLNFKETIKLWILNLFNLDSIEFVMPKIKFNKKNGS